MLVSVGVQSSALRYRNAAMSDFEHFTVHKSADSLSVHKARMARPRFAQESQAAEDEEDELDLEQDQPDSPAPDTEVQARVDSIALAQKRLNAKSSEKSRFDSNTAPKSRFGRVKLPEETEEPASDEKKIKVGSGAESFLTASTNTTFWSLHNWHTTFALHVNLPCSHRVVCFQFCKEQLSMVWQYPANHSF